MATYLVTGASGAFGAWAAKALLELGHSVVSIEHDIHPYDTASLLGIRDKITWARGSITDETLVKRVVADYSPDSIWHLAALPIVQAATRTAVSVFETNTMGTINLLEAVKDSARVGRNIRMVYVSTDKAMGDVGHKAYTEDMPLNPISIYDASKAAADVIARAYAACNDVPALAVARPCNLITPGDMNVGRVLNRIVIPCMRGENPVLYRANNLREYIWVEDAVRALLYIDQELSMGAIHGEAFNVSSGCARTLDECVAAFKKHFPELAPTWVSAPEISSRVEIPYQALATDKAKRLLDWSADVMFEEAVEKLIAWWRQKWAILPATLKTTKVEGWH